MFAQQKKKKEEEKEKKLFHFFSFLIFSLRIQRNCKDYCCRRWTSLIKKSLIRSADADNHFDINDHDRDDDDFGDDQFNWRKLNDCQNVSPENLDSFSVYGLVQIYQPKTKRTICMGSLIHGRLVVTSPDCASM